MQLDEDEAQRVRGGLARGGEDADPLGEVAVARVGDDRQGAGEHVLVGGTRVEAVADDAKNSATLAVRTDSTEGK